MSSEDLESDGRLLLQKVLGMMEPEKHWFRFSSTGTSLGAVADEGLILEVSFSRGAGGGLKVTLHTTAGDFSYENGPWCDGHVVGAIQLFPVPNIMLFAVWSGNTCQYIRLFPQLISAGAEVRLYTINRSKDAPEFHWTEDDGWRDASGAPVTVLAQPL